MFLTFCIATLALPPIFALVLIAVDAIKKFKEELKNELDY